VVQDLISSSKSDLTPAEGSIVSLAKATVHLPPEPPEAALLLYVLRQQFSPAASTIGASRGTSQRELSEGVDWNAFNRLAVAHRVAPLVYRYFQGHPGELPAEVLAQLRQQIRATGFRNLVLTRELVRLAGVFADAGIDFLPLKGPLLAHQLYGDVSQRQFGDLDILVRPCQLGEARELLTREGYRYQDGWDSWRQRAYERFGHHYGYYHPLKSVQVEMHWRVLPQNVRFAIEVPEFWARLERCAIAGVPVPCTPAEDLLLMLTAHGSRHHWERLNWICDIAALLEARPDLDWQVVEQRARRLGAVRMLDLGLLVAHDVLGAPLPAGAAGRLEVDRMTRELGADVRAMLFAGINFEAAVGIRWRYFLRLRERLPHRLSYVVGQTVNSLFWRVISWGSRDEADRSSIA